MSKWMVRILGSAALLAQVGCLGGSPTPTGGNERNRAPAPAVLDSVDTSMPVQTGLGSFNHPDDSTIDPFAALARMQEEGAPEVSSRMHSCQKVKYATLSRILGGLGVDLQASTPAGALFTSGAQAMGVANYPARLGETIALTTSGATKLFDIFVAAAPQVIAGMPSSARCPGVSIFTSDNKCTLEGISCLTGKPATQAAADLCNHAITEATSPAIGQTVAVATILAAAHTCE